MKCSATASTVRGHSKRQAYRGAILLSSHRTMEGVRKLWYLDQPFHTPTSSRARPSATTILHPRHLRARLGRAFSLRWHAAAESAFARIVSERRPCVTTSFILLECGNTAAHRPYRNLVCVMREKMDLRN